MLKYSGMTVNERLWVADLFNEFESAIKEEDLRKAIEILNRVELTEPSVVRAILNSFGLKWRGDEDGDPPARDG